MKNKNKWKIETKVRKTTKKEKVVGLIGWSIVLLIAYLILK